MVSWVFLVAVAVMFGVPVAPLGPSRMTCAGRIGCAG